MRLTKWKSRRTEIAKEIGSDISAAILEHFIAETAKSNYSNLGDQRDTTHRQKDYCVMLLKRTEEIIWERSQIFSAILHEFPKRDPGIRTKSELAQMLNISNITFSKWMEREKFILTVDQIEFSTNYILNLANQNGVTVPIYDGTLHSFWIGTKIEDFHAPVFLNTFINLFLQLPLAERRAFLTQYKKSGEQYSSECRRELFLDRIREQKLYNGNNILYVLPATHPYIKDFLARFVRDNTGNNNYDSDLDRLDIRELMPFIYVLGLPLDYFLCIDYTENLLDKIVFERADGSTFHITPKLYDYNVLKKACRFIVTRKYKSAEEIVYDLTLRVRKSNLN